TGLADRLPGWFRAGHQGGRLAGGRRVDPAGLAADQVRAHHGGVHAGDRHAEAARRRDARAAPQDRGRGRRGGMTVLDENRIAELEKFTPERVDGVDLPANGSSFLMLKTLGAEAAPESTEKAVAPVDAPQDEDVAKDWAAWDAAHPDRSHQAGGGTGRQPAVN